MKYCGLYVFRLLVSLDLIFVAKILDRLQIRLIDRWYDRNGQPHANGNQPSRAAADNAHPTVGPGSHPVALIRSWALHPSWDSPIIEIPAPPPAPEPTPVPELLAPVPEPASTTSSPSSPSSLPLTPSAPPSPALSKAPSQPSTPTYSSPPSSRTGSTPRRTSGRQIVPPLKFEPGYKTSAKPNATTGSIRKGQNDTDDDDDADEDPNADSNNSSSSNSDSDSGDSDSGGSNGSGDMMNDADSGSEQDSSDVSTTSSRRRRRNSSSSEAHSPDSTTHTSSATKSCKGGSTTKRKTSSQRSRSRGAKRTKQDERSSSSSPRSPGAATSSKTVTVDTIPQPSPKKKAAPQSGCKKDTPPIRGVLKLNQGGSRSSSSSPSSSSGSTNSRPASPTPEELKRQHDIARKARADKRRLLDLDNETENENKNVNENGNQIEKKGKKEKKKPPDNRRRNQKQKENEPQQQTQSQPPPDYVQLVQQLQQQLQQQINKLGEQQQSQQQPQPQQPQPQPQQPHPQPPPQQPPPDYVQLQQQLQQQLHQQLQQQLQHWERQQQLQQHQHQHLQHWERQQELHQQLRQQLLQQLQQHRRADWVNEVELRVLQAHFDCVEQRLKSAAWAYGLQLVSSEDPFALGALLTALAFERPALLQHFGTPEADDIDAFVASFRADTLPQFFLHLRNTSGRDDAEREAFHADRGGTVPSCVEHHLGCDIAAKVNACHMLATGSNYGSFHDDGVHLVLVGGCQDTNVGRRGFIAVQPADLRALSIRTFVPMTLLDWNQSLFDSLHLKNYMFVREGKDVNSKRLEKVLRDGSVWLNELDDGARHDWSDCVRHGPGCVEAMLGAVVGQLDAVNRNWRDDALPVILLEPQDPVVFY
jgi:hypothetical protein